MSLRASRPLSQVMSRLVNPLLNRQHSRAFNLPVDRPVSQLHDRVRSPALSLPVIRPHSLQGGLQSNLLLDPQCSPRSSPALFRPASPAVALQ